MSCGRLTPEIDNSHDNLLWALDEGTRVFTSTAASEYVIGLGSAFLFIKGETSLSRPPTQRLCAVAVLCMQEQGRG